MGVDVGRGQMTTPHFYCFVLGAPFPPLVHSLRRTPSCSTDLELGFLLLRLFHARFLVLLVEERVRQEGAADLVRACNPVSERLLVRRGLDHVRVVGVGAREGGLQRLLGKGVERLR